MRKGIDDLWNVITTLIDLMTVEDAVFSYCVDNVIVIKFYIGMMLVPLCFINDFNLIGYSGLCLNKLFSN